MPSGNSTQKQPESEPQPATAETKPPWWKPFRRSKREDEKVVVEPLPSSGIFGVPLQVSIRYANVAISLFDANGRSFIYGYVPIVVAKCGVFLKEKATDVEGIFRLAGAERRIKELQAVFNSPDRYGKGLDWTGYTVHDAANALRRYINLLPEPIVPLEFYARFREPLRHHQAQAVGECSGQGPDIGDFDVKKAIRTYQQLITELPPLNRQLLLYLLDLLAVFAAKSDVNLMTAHNLSSIFQPGLIHDPMHNLSPAEYRLSQDVLIFLIERQDHFLVGMQGTAVDEQTILDVQNGAVLAQRSPSGPNTPKGRTQQLIGRSASTASAGSESARRLDVVRRNLSVSSRNSRQSNNASSPITPPSGALFASSGKGIGIHRSNTLPSRKSPSPALSSERFSRDRHSDAQLIGTINPPIAGKISPVPSGSGTPGLASVSETPSSGITFVPPTTFSSSRSPRLQPSSANSPQQNPSHERQSSKGNNLQLDLPPLSANDRVSPATTPARERSLASLFRQSQALDPEKKDSRKPNKLQKRRLPEGVNSPESSTHSLAVGSQPGSPTYATHATGARQGSQSLLDPHPVEAQPRPSNIFRDHRNEAQSPDRQSAIYMPVQSSPDDGMSLDRNMLTVHRDHAAKASHSPSGSLSSSGSSHEHENGERVKKREKRSRWRLSSPGKREHKKSNGGAIATSLGDIAHNAERSTSTIASIGRSRKSLTDDSYTTNVSGKAPSSNDTDERAGSNASAEKKGAFGWFRDRLGRSKSPVARGSDMDSVRSKQSLSAVATGSDVSSHNRGRSVEALAEVLKEEQRVER